MAFSSLWLIYIKDTIVTHSCHRDLTAAGWLVWKRFGFFFFFLCFFWIMPFSHEGDIWTASLVKWPLLFHPTEELLPMEGLAKVLASQHMLVDSVAIPESRHYKMEPLELPPRLLWILAWDFARQPILYFEVRFSLAVKSFFIISAQSDILNWLLKFWIVTTLLPLAFFWGSISMIK